MLKNQLPLCFYTKRPPEAEAYRELKNKIHNSPHVVNNALDMIEQTIWHTVNNAQHKLGEEK